MMACFVRVLTSQRLKAVWVLCSSMVSSWPGMQVGGGNLVWAVSQKSYSVGR